MPCGIFDRIVHELLDPFLQEERGYTEYMDSVKGIRLFRQRFSYACLNINESK